MKAKILALAAVGLIGLATSSIAGPIPYPNVGTLNPDVYTFKAIANGPIVAYFFGSSAAYGSQIGLSVNNLSTGVYGLQDNLSYYGQMLTLTVGNVSAGDILEFALQVSTSNSGGPPPLSYTLYSTPSDNADGQQHVYSTAWGGDSIIPAGTYVGFEDISPATSGDMDYNDEQFVFTNVGETAPDGGMTISMLGIAFAGLGLLRRKM